MNIGFLTIDCADPETLIAFWSRALGYEVHEGVYTTLRDPGGEGVTLYFQKVPEPRVGKNRVHFDLVSRDYASDIARLTELGATRSHEVGENDLRWTVLEDPEGNVFCVFEDAGS